MSLSGIAFALFLPLVLLLHWGGPRRAGYQNAVLLAASIAFYLTWSRDALLLLLAITVADWALALAIASAREASFRRRLALIASVVMNLGTLGWFKYRGFFLENAAPVLDALGLGLPAATQSVALPLGLSYLTLIRLGYQLDVAHGRIAPMRSLPTFATFVLFFPQLVAGPITRAGAMLPQFAGARHPSWAMLWRAGPLLLLGWWMKGYLADWLAPTVVDPVFAAPGRAGALSHLLALGGYGLQVFFDFAGYSLLAIGTAALFAITLPANFDRPFLSRSMPEFWRRWHISLNTWLFDYLYAPMVTSRGPLHGRLATALVIVFALSGLWHGAAWTFVLWGLLHGVALALHHHWDRWYRARSKADRRWHRVRQGRPYAVVAWAVTMLWFFGSLILFRSPDLGAAAAFVSGLAGSGAGLAQSVDLLVLVNLAVAFATVVWHHAEGLEVGARWRARFDRLPAPILGVSLGLALVWLALFAPLARGSFIYAQF